MRTWIICLFFLFSCCLPGLTLAATSRSIHVEWGYVPPTSPAVTGFKLYQEGVFVCGSDSPAAIEMQCEVSLEQERTTFTMTATFSDGTESPHSEPFTLYNITDEQGETGNKLFTFNWIPPADKTGLNGYRIYLNNTRLCETANPAATTIACKADLLQETMVFSMTAVNADGGESSPSNLIVFDPTAYPELLINTKQFSFSWEYSSTANIKGFRMYQNNALVCQTNDPTARRLTCIANLTTTPASYTMTAVNADNTETGFSNALTYTGGTLTADPYSTATDTTPLDTTATASNPPTAAISSSATTGSAPLTVNFDGSGSTATNATITSYNWNFGDNTSGTGAKISHSYTLAGIYSASLVVTDSKGQKSTTSTPVIISSSGTTSNSTSPGTSNKSPQTVDNSASVPTTVDAEQETADIQIETGEIAVSSAWVRVPLTSSFTNPIVVAGPPSFNKAQSCTVRIRNVDTTGFDIKLTEWDSLLKGTHPQETLSYLVIEKGHHTLPDGTAIEASSFTGTANGKTIPFISGFAKTPVVLATIASMNNTDTVGSRLKNITASHFTHHYQKNITQYLADETVHYIAWEPGSGTIGALRYAVVKTGNSVTSAWYSVTYPNAFNRPPLLLADMQTANDTRPVALRLQNQTAKGFQIKAEANIIIMPHSAETVGYIAIDQPTE
jgi:FOG: PKD repeat